MVKTSVELVKQVMQGDECAYEELYRKCYSQAYVHAYSLCRNEADAHDMAQDSLLQVFKSIHTLNNPEYFDTWFYRIVHSKCTRMFYNNRDALYDPDMLSRSMLLEQRISHQPDKLIQDQTDQEIVRMLVDELKPKLREMIDLYYFQQKSIAEIIELTQLPSGTVKSRIFQARKHLKNKISAFEQREHRKISFHLGAATPSFLSVCALKAASSNLFKHTKLLQAVQVASVTACVTVTTVAVTNTVQVVKEYQEPGKDQIVEVQRLEEAKAKEKEPLKEVNFQTITYKDKQITSPKSAYYTLLNVAPEPSDIVTTPKEELLALQPILNALKNTDTTYIEELTSNGWIAQYEANI